MKILFLEQFSELGGGQRNLLDLLPAVIERGCKAIVAAPGNGPLFAAARAIGAQTESIPFGRYANGQKTPADAARLGIDTFLMSRRIARMDADMISIGGARLLPAAAFGARGRRVIFQAQHFFEDRRALRLARWAIRKSRATVIANSKYVASQYCEAHVVYNGIPEIPFTRRSFVKPWRIGLIGRIAPMKGQTDFLRAAALIPDTRFVICGSPMFCPQSYVDEVNRLARGLPVEFVGWHDDVGEVLRHLDLLAVPSTSAEATTRVILEAFSAGVPVIAYAVGGIPEIVRDQENGFLVPERTPEALAKKILSLRCLPEIAERARADWQQSYRVERYRQNMLSILTPDTCLLDS